MYKNKPTKYIVLFILLLLTIYILLYFYYYRKNEKKFEIALQDSVVVAEDVYSGNLGEHWGYFQFPKLYYSSDNLLVCKVANKPDSFQEYGGQYEFFVSRDLGETWEETDNVPEDHTLKMQNGCYFQGPVLQNGFSTEIEKKYEPRYISEDDSVKLYYADDILEADYKRTFLCEEYNPVTGENSIFESRLNWPYQPVIIKDGMTLPPGNGMYHFRMHSDGIICKKNNGNLLMALYSRGFDAETGETSYGKHYNLYFFESSDSARTWNFVSQILTKPEHCEEEKDGFCEPNIICVGEGKYFVIFRSGSQSPSYAAYSDDDGYTWKSIQRFDKCGVDPQLLQLDCGITLASYGRPGNYIRATDDVDCLSWCDPIRYDGYGDMDFTKWGRFSCSYTSMVALDKNTALLAYSDFQREKAKDDTSIIKSIVVRKIDIVL